MPCTARRADHGSDDLRHHLVPPFRPSPGPLTSTYGRIAGGGSRAVPVSALHVASRHTGWRGSSGERSIEAIRAPIVVGLSGGREGKEAKECSPMLVEKVREAPPLLDILDRVLDKGIVIDMRSAWSVGGVELFTIQGLMVVASIDTHVLRADVIGKIVGRPAARPFSPRLTPTAGGPWSCHPTRRPAHPHALSRASSRRRRSREETRGAAVRGEPRSEGLGRYRVCSAVSRHSCPPDRCAARPTVMQVT